jgi:hypothetical protein
VPSKERLTAQDWAGLVLAAVGKDSKGYKHRLSKWIVATKANPKGRLSHVASVRLASFWCQELVYAAATLNRKNADYSIQLDELSASSPVQRLPDCLHSTGCIDDLYIYQNDILHEQQESVQRRSLAISRILQKGRLQWQEIRFIQHGRLMAYLRYVCLCSGEVHWNGVLVCLHCKESGGVP